jgi:hypothetical protein
VAPAVIELIADPTLLQMVQTYLQCEPVNVQVNTWFTVARDPPLQDVTQTYHQDFSWMKFLKVFIYLNDVKTENGATRYVPNTFDHVTPLLHVKPSYTITSRLTDEQVQTAYPGKEMHFEGPAGSIMLADTQGFHSGTKLTRGTRQMLQLEYASSVQDTSPLRKNGGVSAYVPYNLCKSKANGQNLEKIQRYKRLFSRMQLDDTC